MAPRRMHQTTVRFGADLWQALEEEGSRLGVSVAQYVREAALARLAYSAGKRGDEEFELALEIALGESELRLASEVHSPLERADVVTSDSAALWGQAQQARRRAAELRQASAAQLKRDRPARGAR
jgi:hypothetical protein